MPGEDEFISRTGETHASYQANHMYDPPKAGFNAFGHPVPLERQVTALDVAVEIIGVDAMLADPVIRDAARYIELDKPHEAMLALRNVTDLTGAYRLLAVLCAAPLREEE